jgi:hypothetical protein
MPDPYATDRDAPASPITTPPDFISEAIAAARAALSTEDPDGD